MDAIQRVGVWAVIQSWEQGRADVRLAGRGVALVGKTDEELLEQAAALRGEAGSLLHQEGLLALLRSYGPAGVIGSYALDLMTWPDLDLSVRLPHELDVPTFFAIGSRIVTTFQVAKMSYSNHFVRTDVPFDRGLFWGIRLLYRGRTWKLDLWGYGEEDYRASGERFERLRRRLEQADRMAILRIKDVMCREENYRREVSSLQIYEAVLEDRVETVEGFRGWLARQAQAGV